MNYSRIFFRQDYSRISHDYLCSKKVKYYPFRSYSCLLLNTSKGVIYMIDTSFAIAFVFIKWYIFKNIFYIDNLSQRYLQTKQDLIYIVIKVYTRK